LHYNPYFPGGAIAMPKMLMDGAVEYEDGTPATEAQVTHSLQPAPWNQVWALHYIERMHYSRMQILDGQRCCLILVMGRGT